jgi:hypothetical protein
MLELIITTIIREAPALAIELVQLLNKSQVTESDWEALKARYRGKTYEEYLTAAGAKREP